jgi:hypothetical protein
MTHPRYLAMSMPNASVTARIQACIDDFALTPQLGAGRVRQANWHQSLSDQCWPDDVVDLEVKLVRGCAMLRSGAVTLTLDRITRDEGYCALQGDGTAGFRALLRAVKAAFATQGITSRAVNAPHITLSYWGSAAGTTLGIKPIQWTIDQVVIVKGRGEGDKYRYEVLASKKLHTPPKAEQLALF